MGAGCGEGGVRRRACAISHALGAPTRARRPAHHPPAVQAPWFRSSIPSGVRWVSWRSSYRTAARTVIYITARCGHVHDGQVDHRNCRGSVILHPSIHRLCVNGLGVPARKLLGPGYRSQAAAQRPCDIALCFSLLQVEQRCSSGHFPPAFLHPPKELKAEHSGFPLAPPLTKRLSALPAAGIGPLPI